MSRRRSHATTRSPDHHLRQVLVRRADYHLTDPGVILPADGGGGDGVVGFELGHGPDHQPQRPGRPLRQLKLRLDVLGHTVAGLVPVKQVISEGLDHVVESAGDVGHVFLPQQNQQGLYQPAGGGDLPPVRGLDGRQAVVGPEQLVSAIQQVNVHDFSQ